MLIAWTAKFIPNRKRNGLVSTNPPVTSFNLSLSSPDRRPAPRNCIGDNFAGMPIIPPKAARQGRLTACFDLRRGAGKKKLIFFSHPVYTGRALTRFTPPVRPKRFMGIADSHHLHTTHPANM
jgi:hypothetical protein